MARYGGPIEKGMRFRLGATGLGLPPIDVTVVGLAPMHGDTRHLMVDLGEYGCFDVETFRAAATHLDGVPSPQGLIEPAVREGTLTLEYAMQRHVNHHAALDELVACWIEQTGGLPSQHSIMELMKWSHQQTLLPTCRGIAPAGAEDTER